MANVTGDSADNAVAAVRGEHAGDGKGVEGESNIGPGVFGHSTGTGVWGASQTWMGVYGSSSSTTGGAGVMGEATGSGVIGVSKTWMGVYGETQSTTGGAGVWGEHKGAGIGVVGRGNDGNGGWFESNQARACAARPTTPTTGAWWA